MNIVLEYKEYIYILYIVINLNLPIKSMIRTLMKGNTANVINIGTTPAAFLVDEAPICNTIEVPVKVTIKQWIHV
jgi:hypothetical protein